MLGYTCSKDFEGYPCCHRQWKHPGHCRFVHGYSRSFSFWFLASKLDQYGFVVDFSDLKPLEEQLRSQFDHTFLINKDDPLLPFWQQLHEKDALDLRIMENVGMESTAELVWTWANTFLRDRYKGRACCWRTQARENNLNSAFFEMIPTWYQNDNYLSA